MVYIDSNFCCHATNPDGIYREVETDFFNGKCVEFIEGFRFKPSGESWTREDGEVFEGEEMITPWKDFNELESAQRAYEQELLVAEYETLINELYSEVTAE